MFCDIVGSTPMVERLGSEDAYYLMGQVYEILIHSVDDFEGTINEMPGDGIMAIDIVLTPVLIQALGMDRKQFIDLCIILQCDFNVRMPGIGKVGALKMIRKHGCIENAMKENPSLPWENLCYERCREIFSTFDTGIDLSSLCINQEEMRKGLLLHPGSEIGDKAGYILPPRQIEFS